MKATKLLGNAEEIGGNVWIRLSRIVDPSRKRIPLRDIDPNLTTIEEGRLAAHRLSVEALDNRLQRSPKPGARGETVEDWFDLWHTEREKRGIVTTSRHDRSRLTEHVFPIIGEWRMATVPREKIEEVVESLDEKIAAGKLSWKTAASTWGVISKGFKDAINAKAKALRVRVDNPALGVSPPERGAEKSKAFLYPSEFWTLVTSRKLIEGAGLPAHLAANVAKASRRWLRCFVLSAYSGLRAGELAALDWQDLDLKHWTILVHRSTKRDTGRREEKETKTGVTRRFELEPALRPLLLAMWREQGKPTSGKVIKMPHEADLSARLKKYLQWAGVKRAELYISDKTRCAITYKDLRATYATWRAIRGDDPLKIQRAAGHKSLNTTQIYIRAAEDLGHRAGKPFPPLPSFVLGETATPRAHLENVSKAARPKPVPKLSQENRKRAKPIKKIASPAGFECKEVPLTPRKTGRFGTIVPTNRGKRSPTRDRLGTEIDPISDALERGLAEAIDHGRTNDAAKLAEELAARRALLEQRRGVAS